ncbi:MAG: hypothetical protein MZV70_48355 [Desulfobacterales bacterium]|nr:hypothetical protein [Desulfobacterales bacterium]
MGREYTLMQKGKIELEYSLRYEYISSSEILDATSIVPRSNHTVRNAIGVQYGLLNNVTVNINIPYVCVYDKTGSASAKDNNDMGDVTLDWTTSPSKAAANGPRRRSRCRPSSPRAGAPTRSTAMPTCRRVAACTAFLSA